MSSGAGSSQAASATERAAQTLYAYSLVRTLAEGGRDYADALIPLIVKGVSLKHEPQTVETLQGLVKGTFALDIPQHSLQTIITRAKRRGLLTQRDRRVFLTEQGREFVDGLESQEEADRRIREVAEAARGYLRDELSLTVSVDRVAVALANFLSSNAQLAESFAGGAPITAPPTAGNAKDIEAGLLAFLEFVESSQPALYRTVVDLARAGVVAVSLYGPSLAEAGKKFDSHTLVFLDTNVLLSLFEFHFGAVNKPILELHQLLRDTPGIDLKVFDFTLDELVGVLTSFARQGSRYSPKIRVNSIYSSLRAKGWNSIDVREFVVDLERLLAEKEISVHPTRVNLDTFQFGDLPASRLDDYKPNQPDRGRCHDLAAIEQVRMIRGRAARRLEESRAFFLTADMKLARFDYNEMGHRQRESIAEVIPDRLLTTVLWLKDPARLSELTLSSVIALHSRELLVDRRVWERFFEIVEQLRSDGTLPERDVSLLLFYPLVERLLIDVGHPDAITKDWVLNAVDVSKNRIEEEAEARAAEREMAALADTAAQERRFQEREEQLRRDGIEQVLATIASTKQAIRERTARDAAMWMTVLWLLGAVALAVVGIIAWVRWQSLFVVVVAIATVLAWFLGLAFDFKRWPARLKDFLFERLYARRLRRSALTDLEGRIGG